LKIGRKALIFIVGGEPTIHDWLTSKAGEEVNDKCNALHTFDFKATGAAHDVVEQASQWSSRNAEQLAQLLDRHQAHLDQISDVRTTLDSVLVRFQESLGQYATVTVELRQISTQVSTLAPLRV
jgi:hypothetical protein